jgi:pimeloyl-ACP methyl ester carboxylesterase
LAVEGIATHWRELADPPHGQPPVLLLHGLAVSHRYLMPTALDLAATHPVYLPDLPGFGHSGKARRVFDAAAHADHLAAWLARIGLARVCVLGHSFGAEVAAALAVRHPARVGALVLVGPTSDPAARSHWGQLRRWLVDLLREDPRQALILLRDVRDAGPRRIAGTLTRSVRHPMERTLAGVRAPTLLLRGSRDPVVPERWLREAAAIVAGAGIGTVAGAAHNVATTAGTEVAAAVLAFLAVHRCRFGPTGTG